MIQRPEPLKWGRLPHLLNLVIHLTILNYAGVLSYLSIREHIFLPNLINGCSINLCKIAET